MSLVSLPSLDSAKCLRAFRIGSAAYIGKRPYVHGLKIYALQTPDSVQVRIEPVSFSELKIKYENRLKSQNLRIESPVLIDPLTGIETACSIEALSIPFEPEILAETPENTLDSDQKPPSRIESNLPEPEDWKAAHPD